ncbi:hypothetical protein ALC62_01078 [Cyphomyrmex costatus]|uniref:Uncharacterized protein n=1 Tax=Cyphomyrmex costatus TaxID=456900 RepID=A0A195D4X1_9HYME|nr:hypothetical protein ALC62_01078 [Cyphomyrmex costatus]
MGRNEDRKRGRKTVREARFARMYLCIGIPFSKKGGKHKLRTKTSVASGRAYAGTRGKKKVTRPRPTKSYDRVKQLALNLHMQPQEFTLGEPLTIMRFYGVSFEGNGQ